MGMKAHMAAAAAYVPVARGQLTYYYYSRLYGLGMRRIYDLHYYSFLLTSHRAF